MGLLVFSRGGGLGTHFPPFKFLGGTLPSGIPMTPWKWLDGGSGVGRATAENVQINRFCGRRRRQKFVF